MASLRRLTNVALILWLAISSCDLSTSDSELPYEFKTVWESRFVSVQAIDVNQDGIGELVFDDGSQIDVMDCQRSSFIASFIKVGAHQTMAAPLITGALDSLEFLFFTANRETVKADLWREGSAVHQAGKIKNNFFIFAGKDRDENGAYHQVVYPGATIHDSQNRRLHLFILNSGKDAAKRGIIAVEMKSEKIAWEYLCGPQVTNYVIGDVDGDGRDEIAFGTYAPDNGAEYNGSKDDSSFVFLLDGDGRLRWRKPIGPYFTGGAVNIGDLNDDGQKDIVAYRYTLQAAGEPPDDVMLLRATDGHAIKTKRIGKSLTAASYPFDTKFCRDLNGDGLAEIVVGNTDGFVRMFDGDLNDIAQSEPFNAPVTVTGIGDFDGDKVNEIACVSAENNLAILSYNLKPLLGQKLPPTSEVRVVQGSRRPFFLVASYAPAGGKALFALLEFHKLSPVQMAMRRKPYWQWVFAAILFIAALIYARNLFYGAHGKRMLFSLLERSGLLNGTLALKRDGKIVKMGNDWGDLFSISPANAIGKNLRQIFSERKYQPWAQTLTSIIGKQEPEQTNELAWENRKIRLSSFYMPLLQIYFVYLFDLSEQEYLRHVKSWAHIAQRLAHGIKNPLTTVKLNAEDLHDLIKTRFDIVNPEIESYFTAILSQVNRLTRMSDGFMRFSKFDQPDLQPVELNDLIKELYPQWLPEKSAGILVEFQSAENLPPALIDREQFAWAFKNVFYNALDSFANHGRIFISTSLAQLFVGSAINNYIELQIRDNGCGIPREFLPKLGEPYFTLKADGTGMGLSLVKKIMEEHEGAFEIDSDEGLGTVVTLRFRVAPASREN
jgi:signal transduction histidine kinase